MEPVYSGTERVALVLEEESLRRTAPRGRRLSMKKNYVLDTNVLLYDPQAIFKFEDNDVIIPIYVIEEVDQFKREGTERGRNARTIARLLDALRPKGSLASGVKLETGGGLKIAIPAKRPILPTA